MTILAKSLRARLVSYFLLLSLLTVILVAYAAFQQARDAITQQVFERLEAVASLKEGELNRWVGDQSQRLLLISRALEVRAQAGALLGQGDLLERQAAHAYLLQYLASVVDSQPDLQEIFIMADLDGRVILSTNEKSIGALYGSDLYFVEGRWRTYVQNVYHSADNKPLMTVAAPLFSQSGERVGVLAAHLNLDRMDAVILEPGSLGNSGEIYMVDRLNTFVSSERFGREGLANARSQGIDAALQEKSGAGLYLNYRAQPVIGVYRWVPKRELALLAEMHQEEAFAPASRLGVNIFFIGATLAALLAMGVYLLVRRLTWPVFDLVAGAERVTQGNLDEPVPVRSRDELGLLAGTFNSMQAGLRESRLQLQEYAHTLERRVAERTAELEQANQALSRRAVQLETSSQVARRVISILDLDELLAEIVRLIQERYAYYFVGVWLIAGQQAQVVLRAGTGRVGKDLSVQGVAIPLAAASIIASVCRTGQLRLVEDVSQSPDYMPFGALPEVRSELVLPLCMGKTIVGALAIQSDHLAGFGPDDQIALQTLADQIAIAIRNAQLYQAEQTRRRLAEALEQAGRELSSDLDLREVPERILEQLARVVPYDHGAVMLQYGDTLRSIALRGFSEAAVGTELSICPEEGDVIQRILSTGQPMRVDDWDTASERCPANWLAADKAWVGVPLIARDQVLGLISLSRQAPAAFHHEEVMLVTAFAGQAAVAFENASLYDEISRFTEQLEQMVLQRTEELNRAYQMLERLDKTKTDFINVAAHELRTPLTLIKGYAQLLESSAQGGDPETKMLVEGILAGQDRLHEILNSLLDVSRITSHAMEVCKEQTNLADLFTNIFASFKATMEERRLTLTASGLQDLPVIQADPNLISKVFYHLIINAIKYTPDGGSIAVTGGLIAKVKAEPVVEIVVSDTGIGIDPAHHQLIFTKFFQTGKVDFHSSGKTKFKGGGPGLGLAIAQGIVLAHEGKIWVESQGYDEVICPGSQFHVCLPVGQPGVGSIEEQLRLQGLAGFSLEG